MLEKGEKHEENEVEQVEEFLPEDVEIEIGEEEESMGTKLKNLREKLSACEDEKRNHLEEIQKIRADFLNSRRRLEEQLALDKERATDKILYELLNLVDSFDTAMIDKELWETIDKKWRIGIEGIHAKLLALLKSNNVIPTDPTGLQFNPAEHEAVSNANVNDDAQVDTIIAVLQKGFKRNDSVMRPAKVVVGVKKH